MVGCSSKSVIVCSFGNTQPLRRGRTAQESPAQQALPGDPDRGPGSLVQRRRLAVLPRHPGVLRRHHAGPYIPDTDLSPIWNPEFFGTTIMVNGKTWPFQKVERRRYRFRFLNGCQSRFLILDFSGIPGVEAWPIGNEGGFLAAPVNLTADNGNRLLMGLAERADLIVDFTNVPVGNYVLGNVGPDEPFGGGEPRRRLRPADPDTTGQILQFRVVPAVAPDPPRRRSSCSCRPSPRFPRRRHPAAGVDRREADVLRGRAGRGHARHRRCPDGDVATGVWTARDVGGSGHREPGGRRHRGLEIYNTTADAHPMHVHEVVFEVVDRQDIS